MYSKKCIFLMCLCLILLFQNAEAYIEKSGSITENETWGEATYFIKGTIFVRDDVILTLEPGAILKFRQNTGLTVYGTLHASGSEGQKIIFTSCRDGESGEAIPADTCDSPEMIWNGIYLEGQSGYEGIGNLDNCVIRHGGDPSGNVRANIYYHLSDSGYLRNSVCELSANNGVVIEYCSPSLENNEFNENNQIGILAESGTPVIIDNSFENNGDYASYLSGVNLTSYTGNDGQGNGINGFGVEGEVDNGSNLTWSMGSGAFPFVLIDHTEVRDGGTLNLSEGTTLKALSGIRLKVRGTLEATSVVFTSFKDDAHGGDTDGETSVPEAGDWHGIEIESGTGKFEGCEVLYGGKSTAYTSVANIRFINADSSSCFKNSYSKFSYKHGVVISGCSPTISGSHFSNSEQHGMYAIGGTAAPVIENNTFSNNVEYGAYLHNIDLTSYTGNWGSENGVNGFALSGTVRGNSLWSIGTSSGMSKVLEANSDESTEKTNFPFIIIKDEEIHIPENSSLEMYGGVIIKADSSAFIDVEGTLDIDASPEDSVVITSLKDDGWGGDTNNDGQATSPSPGDWDGIYVEGDGLFSYCLIQYGGNIVGPVHANVYFHWSERCDFQFSASRYSAEKGVRVTDCSPIISDCLFSDNTEEGLYVRGTGSSPVITNNTFNDNGGFGALVENASITSYSGNEGIGNGINGLGVHGRVDSSCTWSMPHSWFPFVITNIIDVNRGATLTLSEGTIIKFSPGSLLYVKGQLEARGYVGSGKVFFTSLYDDSSDVGGDTNGDGKATFPQPGDWKGIHLDGVDEKEGVGHFINCQFRYGGKSGQNNPYANVYMEQSDTCCFQGCYCGFSANHGLRIHNCSPYIFSSTFYENASHGIFAEGNLAAPTIEYNDFLNNGENDEDVFGIKLNNVTFTSYAGNKGSGNSINGFALSGTVRDISHWEIDPSEMFPFVMTDDITVESGAMLVLDNPTVIKALPGSALRVNGTLDVNGNGENQVVFTSMQDDFHGGDTNGDGSLTSPMNGDWEGIHLDGQGDNQGIGMFDWFIVKYGGHFLNSNLSANIHFHESDSSYLNNGTIQFSQKVGVRITDCSPRLRNNTITENLEPGVYMDGNGRPDLGDHPKSSPGGNTIRDNDLGGYQAYNNTTFHIKAFCNSWGYDHADSIDAHLYDDEEGGYTIYFDPWMEKKECTISPTAKKSGGAHGVVGEPISTATGELYNDMVDMYLGGPLPLYFSRYYASLLTHNGNVASPLGNNWMHNFDLNLIINGNEATVIYSGGKTIPFQQDGSDWILADPEPVIYQLVESGDDFMLLDPSSNLIYTFGNDGKLTRITDRNGNAHTLTYNGDLLSQVSDGTDRTLNFTYTGELLTQVQDHTGRSIAFTYDGNDLTEYTDARGNVTEYTYTEAGELVGLMTTWNLPEGNTPYTQTYDDQGRVDSQTDSEGNTTFLEYDTLSFGITTVTDPLLNSIQHTHEDLKLLTQGVDENGETYSLTYDDHNRRNGLTDRLSDVTSLTYHDPSGKLSSYTDAEGNMTSFIYTAQTQEDFTYYNLTEIDYPDATSVNMTYDQSGNMQSRVDQVGNTWAYTYNDKGQVLSINNPVNGEITYSYGMDANLVTVTDHFSNTTEFDCDAQSRPVQITNADGTFRSFSYDDNGNVLTVIDERGNTTTYTYDLNNNLKTTTDPIGYTVTMDYDGNDRTISIVDQIGKVTTFTYDECERLRTLTNPAGETITYGYDAHGWLTTITDPGSKTTTWTYDKEGVISSMTDPLFNTWNYTTDKLGRVTRMTTPLGNAHDYVYDSMGRITSYINPLSRTINYAYDDRGLLTEMTLPGGISASYERNDLGLITRITDPNGNNWERTYDEMGRLTSRTDPLSNSSTYTYDSRNRVSQITFPESSLDILYDESGNIVRRLYSDGTDITYTFDENNRLLTAEGLNLEYDARGDIIGCNGLIITRDDAGRMATITFTSEKTVTYAYNNRGLVSQVTDWLGGTTDITYDDAGQIKSLARPNGIIANYDYDNDGRLVGITEEAWEVISHIALTRNEVGFITSANRNVPLVPDLDDEPQEFDYNEACQVSHYTYDNMGRLTEDGNRSYIWDLSSRLTSYAEEGSTFNFTYDGIGMRISKTSGGSSREYVWNYAFGMPSVSVIREDGNDLNYYIHLPDGQLLYSIEVSNSTRFYHFDEMGTTLFLTDSSGNITDTYGITPYGEVTTKKGYTENPFTFSGAYGVMQEGNTGLYYMRARYFDSVSGRFISRDPVKSIQPKHINPYQYAMANPLQYMDILGLQTPDRNGEKDEKHVDGELLEMILEYLSVWEKTPLKVVEPPSLQLDGDSDRKTHEEKLKDPKEWGSGEVIL